MYVINYLSSISDIMETIIVQDGLFTILWILEKSESVSQFKVFSNHSFSVIGQDDWGWTCFEKWVDTFNYSRVQYGK